MDEPQKQPQKQGQTGIPTVPALKKSSLLLAIAAGCVLLLSLLAMVSGSPVQALQQAAFLAMKIPFETLYINGIKLLFTPYFIYNILLACLSAGGLALIYAKKTPFVRPLAANKKKMFFAAAVAVIHAALVTLFLMKALYGLQAVLFGLEMLLLFRLAVSKDREAAVDNRIKGIVPVEAGALIAFSVLTLLLNMTGWNSWKFSFIGDEWIFFNHAKDILKGTRPADLFSGSGVYDFNPVMSSVWQSIIMSFTGQGLFGWKLSSAVIVPLAIMPFYVWNKTVFNRTAAIIATAAFALSAPMLAFSHIGYNNIQAIFFYAACLMALEMALRKNSAVWMFTAALLLGLGCYTYYLSRLMIIIAFMYWILHPDRKKYAAAHIGFGLIVYGLAVSLLPLGSGFVENMLSRSAVSGSEVADAAARPWYVLTNYIQALFFFVTKAKDTHYITGGMMDLFTAAGVILGFAWAFIAATRDWRAKFLLLSYFSLVFFAGGLVQYHYPAVTRMQFLAPLLATAAGIGLARAGTLVTRRLKKPLRAYAVFIAVSVALIALLNFHKFFIQPAGHFKYTMQSLIIKYGQENRQRNILAVVPGLNMTKRLAGYYGLDSRVKVLRMDEFDAFVKNNSAAGSIAVFEAIELEPYGSISGLCGSEGIIARNNDGDTGLYVFDFARGKDDFKWFSQVWKTAY